jgi:DNA modification methylase
MNEYKYEEITLRYDIGDCRDLMKRLPDKSIDLVITSPPYNMGGFQRNQSKRKTIGGYGDYADNLPEDEYRELITDVLSSCVKKLSDRGSIFWNMKEKWRKKECCTPFWFLEVAKANGLNLTNVIVWEFPSGGDTTYSKLWCRKEYIFYLRKDKNNYIWNPDKIRVPTKYFTDKRYNKNGKNPSDVWHLDYDERKEDTYEFTPYGQIWYITHNLNFGKTHPATFPFDLVYRCMLPTTEDDSLVLDPFLGSGTTLMVCRKLRRNGIGFELNPEYEDLIRKRAGFNILI